MVKNLSRKYYFGIAYDFWFKILLIFTRLFKKIVGLLPYSIDRKPITVIIYCDSGLYNLLFTQKHFKILSKSATKWFDTSSVVGTRPERGDNSLSFRFFLYYEMTADGTFPRH
ncbi:hypothetical protein QFZ37_001999 [Chryseobacterium ginsenosidimutans]|uniref:hypothetical protein n=1 Tax=Chryseobacterium ginsenosidimutans TaxID=687846 RepID=UPI00277E8BAB|nr:hypothetical protein [Chryseobacterium ginsenosidimutans]MDQ0593630.1 hypothetical protein [Chryseobacterium ginsenosidimutans]